MLQFIPANVDGLGAKLNYLRVCEFVAPHGKKNSVAMLSQGYIFGGWKRMFY